MLKSQQSWVQFQHPPTQWNLRCDSWRSVGWSKQKKFKISRKNYVTNSGAYEDYVSDYPWFSLLKFFVTLRRENKVSSSLTAWEYMLKEAQVMDKRARSLVKFAVWVEGFEQVWKKYYPVLIRSMLAPQIRIWPGPEQLSSSVECFLWDSL